MATKPTPQSGRAERRKAGFRAVRSRRSARRDGSQREPFHHSARPPLPITPLRFAGLDIVSFPRQRGSKFMPIRVSIVEDDAPYREALRLVFNGAPGFQCVSVHASTEDALAHLPGAKTDVVLMDLNLPGLSGVEGIRRLKERTPELLAAILTIYEETDKIFESLRAGASGYILKKTQPAQILEAVAELMAGGSPMSPSIARKVTQFFHRLPPPPDDLAELTDREREILHEVAAGATDKETGQRLGISSETVRVHLRSIYRKLQVNTRTAAAKKYFGR